MVTIIIDEQARYNSMQLHYSQPELLTTKNILYWSKSAKELKSDGIRQGSAIIAKAKKLNELNLVKYDTYTHEGYILPIKGYNKTTYKVTTDGYNYACNCQFYNTVSKNWLKPSCSHIQALKFYLEIQNWNGAHT